jgi:FAD-dependent urate hydroxylase
VSERLDVAVVGAGPFGLSVAAHLNGLEVRTFGAPMQTWRRHMPSGMTLRSAWEETSLSAPAGAGSIDEWCRVTGGKRVEPIPLDLFVRYSLWFKEQYAPDGDPDDVVQLEREGRGFRITTTAGAEATADRVVLAVGVMPFAYVPPALAHLPGEHLELATSRPDELARHADRRLLVVGGGQAGLERAGLAAQAGAKVELVTLSHVRWFADREPHATRGRIGTRLYRLAYPVVGYGPPPLNRIVTHPDLFARLPAALRRRLTRRLLRSGGSPWLRILVDRGVTVTEQCTVAQAEKVADGLLIHLTDGTTRAVDAISVACGYRFDLSRLTMLAPELRANIAVRDGWPVLDRFFRSTDPGIFFVGYPAEGRFGPLSRFVLGAGFAARRVASALH